MRSRGTTVVHTFYDEEDREIEVEAKILPGDPGRTYGPPEHCYPPEPPEVEDLQAIWVETKQPLTEEEIDRYVDKDILFEEAAADDPQDDGDRKYDEWKDRQLEQEDLL